MLATPFIFRFRISFPSHLIHVINIQIKMAQQQRGALRNDPRWKDIEPLPEPPNSDHLIKIHATSTFLEIMGYFRAIIAKQELSERALDLTMLVIGVNSSNYTAWHYRRRCLLALGKDPEEELLFIGK